jgi:hypothetical protein
MGTPSSILLSTAYLPPVQYISKFLMYEKVLIEKHEHLQKQSYRNRCYIYGANGRQCLVIPLKKKHDKKALITDVEIDYEKNWKKVHLKSIESAYRLSPFYEYYADDLAACFETNPRHIFNLNHGLLSFLLRALDIRKKILTTRAYKKIAEHAIDMRQSIHPKARLALPDPCFEPVSYQQVFQERYGFQPNLSTIDLLFNEGPQAVKILENSIRIHV